MASSVARFRHLLKPTPEKVSCVRKNPEPDVLSRQEHYPTFTKALYVSTFPPSIRDTRPDDTEPSDPGDLLTIIKFLGSGRMGQAHLAKRHNFVKLPYTKIPSLASESELRVVWSRIDSRVIDYVDAVRIKEPFTLDRNGRSPFMCNILLSFRSRFPVDVLHYDLVCEYSNGQRSICECLGQVGRLSENGAKLYLLELADALFYIHKFGKIFRRLCTCYLLIKVSGHLLLSPYTMCKQNLDCGQACNLLTNNCGDQHFASPEIVFGVDVMSTTDWWSYGVIFYRMLTSELPFNGRTLGDLGKAITEAPLEIPSYVTPEATAFIKQLLHRDPRRRLGFGESASRDIQRHPFFSGIDWKDVRSLVVDIKPPFKRSDYL